MTRPCWPRRAVRNQIATPSSRQCVDGVEVDAKNQHERAVKFDFHTARDEVVLAVAGARDGRSYERPRSLDDDAGQREAGEAREAQLHSRLHGAPHPGVVWSPSSVKCSALGLVPVRCGQRDAGHRSGGEWGQTGRSRRGAVAVL